MKLPVTIHQARLGAENFKVIRPARPLPHAVLVDRDLRLNLCLDQESAQHIGALWTLAATSPRALIHLPLRATQPGAQTLDLVLLHHSRQFAPSRWKDVRRRLPPGRPRTITLPDAPLTDEPETDPGTRHHRENRDRFHQHLHAETLFMTGSAKLFKETTNRFSALAQHTPTPPTTHHCTAFHSTDGTLTPTAREIHIELGPR
ncbi:hypothetical protein ACH4OW_01775 [Streptomyces sp. NPDC017056]|uniref:hypothetical protein n=1 Tax=Streptomyces sp. NPDC017056 TaxID=3364973 RepID=UPI003791E065